jgi:hypothetical protein
MAKAIAKNRSQPKKGWGKDIGTRYGRADEGRRHVADGRYQEFQARPWGGDRGNIVSSKGHGNVMKGQRGAPQNHPGSKRNAVDDNGDTKKMTTSRGRPKMNVQFATPSSYRGGESYSTGDNTNYSQDHAGNAADYHRFGGTSGAAHSFKGARGY